MKPLRDCLGKVVGKLITKADADSLMRDSYALKDRGFTEHEAERQAVQNALEEATARGEAILDQILAQRPDAHAQAEAFWNRETLRRAMGPPPLPAFVTEAGRAPAEVPPAAISVDEIVAVHNAAGGSTINAFHGDLIGGNAYSVSVFPDLGDTSPGKNITPEQINKIVQRARAAGIDMSGPNVSVGTWYDEETNTTFIDVVFTTTDRARAIALGQQFNQKAIYDLHAKAEIPTGGTGVVPENLSSIAERLDNLFPPGYISSLPSYEGPIQAAPPAAGAGTAIRAGQAVTGGLPGVPQDLGGVSEEAAGLPRVPEEAEGVAAEPPPIPAEPISDAAQEVVNSLPEEQRDAAQKAFARDDRDPLADDQRSKGQHVKTRAETSDPNPVPPEKSKLVAEASKYGVFDKSPEQVLRNIASDPKQPRWVRLLTDLFIQLGLGQDVTIRMVNSPDASWSALNISHHDGTSEILINLSYAKGPGLARILLHELMHHGTLLKIDAAESDLTPAEFAAKRELQKIFEYVREHPELFKDDATRDRVTAYGAIGSLREFISEIFANDDLRVGLNAIKPDGKMSILARITDAILNMFIGDRYRIGMRKGSMLEAAIREALNIAGSPRVEIGPPGSTAAMQERRSRAARLANAFPAFQEQIYASIAPMGGTLHAVSEEAYRYGWNKNQNAFDRLLGQYPHMRNELVQAFGKGARGARATIAPMAAEHNMGISKADQIARKTGENDPAVAFYTEKERAILEPMIDRQAAKLEVPATKAEIAKVKKRLGIYIKDVRNQNPPSAGWAHSEIDPTPAPNSKKDSITLRRGAVTKADPQGQLIAEVNWRISPYTFARDDDGKAMPRFLRQSKADAVAGKPMVENPEWVKRRAELGDKMFDEMQVMMSRTDPRRNIILEQIDWYRDMVAHLRTSFGSMSDYMADVLAGFSPQTGVRDNWVYMVDYFEKVMKGDYDKIFSEFDKYIREDPENRTATTWKKAGKPMPMKSNDTLFGANTANAMMAGLDLWRQVKFDTAPKARNFGMNLIGLSIKATIDRWAARFLQRMHNPNWRLPPLIEGEVTGKHMRDVEFVAGDFGMGQDVFADVAKRLQESGMPEFKNLTPADLQAILWFAEKEYWETRSWTPIAGAQSSMNAMAEATSAQRYEAGVKPEVTALEKKMASETTKFRAALHKDKTVIGGKIVPTVSVYKGEQLPTIDADWVTHPEYNPTNSVSDLARTAASLGRDAAHISRVILDPDEDNPNATSGLHIFFKERVSEKEIQPVIDQLKEAGLDGVIFSIDPRVRPEIIKSLDPDIDPNQYTGVRIQHIPQYGTAGEIDSNKLKEIFSDVARELLISNANIADARVLKYDTLVLEKGIDYDTKGRLTPDVSGGRTKAWTQRSLDAGFKATARRDRAKREIDDRQKQFNDLERRNKREEQERLDEIERQAAAQQAEIDSANQGGIDPPSVAAMSYGNQEKPVRDPHGGRALLVRAMVNALTGASRDKGGIEVPKSEQEVRGVADLGRGEDKGRKGSAALWRPLGETFRKREASLYSKVDSAARLIQAANPEDPDNPKDPARYQNSQALLDYLSGKQEPADPELKAEITELRKEIPVIPRAQFKGLRELDVGSEADVYHDPNSGVVYKFFHVRDGALEGSYVPGQIRLDRGGGLRIGMGERPTVTDFLSRMERANSQGAITPHELTAITPEGQLVFTQPFVEGREVTQKNLPAALARAGIHFLSDLGAISGIAKVDNRWVVYDDLHPGNVRTMPGGRVEVIDANNRELDAYEIADLTTLGKMPPEKPPGTPKERRRKLIEKYDNAIVVAPMVEAHHGTPHEWLPEKKVRFFDGTTQWVSMDEDVPPDTVVVERAPAGRVRAEKVGAGEGHAAYGWGVLYSAQERKVAEGYREQLSGKEGRWFIDNEPIEYYRSEEYEPLLQALTMVDPDRRLDVSIADTIEEFHKEADYREKRAAPRAAHPQVHLSTGRSYRKMAEALEKFKDRIEFRKGAGNIYTLQLDVDDPELLDWFKPMSEQSWVVDNVLKYLGHTRESALKAYEHNEMLADIANDLQNRVSDQISGERSTELSTAELQNRHAIAEKEWEKDARKIEVSLGQFVHRMDLQAQAKQRWASASEFTGEKFYNVLGMLGDNKTKKDASMLLKSAGVPGIVFLDQESRGKQRPPYRGDTAWLEAARGFKDYGYSIEDTRKGMLKAYTSASAAELNAAIDEAFDVKPKTTNNYVMFDPERIKVVAKNGEVVKTVADDMPAPVEPKYEPVSVAAMSSAEVKDDTDLSVAPMAGRGSRARYSWLRRPEPVEGYKPGGLLTPHAQLSKEVGNFVQEREQREKAVAYRAEAMVKDLERALKKGYGKQGPDKTQLRDVQVALGNLDTRLTTEQYNESLKYTGEARESFLETARNENVDTARANQQTALASLPGVVRKYVNKLRDKLDTEAKELSKGLAGTDTELRARIDNEMGVFLHADSFQHFESDVWGKYIKSDDPEAQRIQRAAETLFKNEIIAEKARAYQIEQDKLGRTVSDAEAVAHASALSNIDQMTKNRLAAYLRKNANEATRMHLLTGKMPIYKVPESGKLLSLNRESIPQEVRELWGQWTNPKINFVKTYTLLANHNADLRMQQSIVDDGTRPETNYIWKPDPNNPDSSPGEGLVALGKAGDDGPLADAYGPQELKEGLATLNNPAVQDTLIQINRWTLMMKTVGSIASAVHNFAGNIAFSIANGNLLWAATMAPKTLISSAFDSFVTTFGRATGMSSQDTQDKITEMIDLGIFDSDIAINSIKAMAKAAQAGIAVEKKLGPAAGLHAAWRVLKTAAVKTGGAFKATYQAADNWWKYFNYQIELAKQKWFYSGVANPPSLEEMKREAANQVMNTLPSYSRVPELVRRGLTETPLKYTGAFFTFQTESVRTVYNNGASAITEFVKGNAKQKIFAGYRTAGMMAMLTMPYLLTSLSKWMYGYDDEDEEALRNSLPEYQKNASLLFMLPKDENGNPRYVDVSFLNPWGLFHSSWIAGRRAYHEGKSVPAAVGKAAFHVVSPLLTVQPGIGNLMSAALNRDYARGGMQIYNPEDTAANIFQDVSWFMAKGFLPGTATNAWKAYQSAQGIKDTSGREPDPLQDITAGLAGLPRVNTLELERAMATQVNTYGKRMGDATRLLQNAVRTKATVDEGEVGDAYRQTNAQTQEIFADMNRAYKQMLKLGMDEDAAREAMEIGFGDEILKSGLSKKKIDDIIDGVFPPIELSDKMLESAEEYHPERLEEYEKALEDAQAAHELQNSG